VSALIEAAIEPGARIGRDVRIGHATRVYASAVIEDGCRIGDFCIIGHPTDDDGAAAPLRIGRGSTVRSHSVIYAGSEFGEGLETGHHVLIREGTSAGANLRVGSYSDIEGRCRIGDYGRFHGYVHVGRGSRIGHFVWLYSLATLTNDALPPSAAFAPVEIEDGVVVCVGATLMPGTVLRRGCFVAAQSCARGVCPPGAVISGPEGRVVSHVSLLRSLEHGLQHPWMTHFDGGYPPEARARLKALGDAIVAEREDFLRRHAPAATEPQAP
jgi:acetyltransferase-like isoleucine patch superfamily enzyme